MTRPESWMTSHDPDFWVNATDVCGLYVDPPVNAVAWSVDETTASRPNPWSNRREFEYRRHCTAVLYAGLNVHDGQVTGWVTDSTLATTSSRSWPIWSPRRRPGWSCTASWTTCPRTGSPAVEAFLDQHPHVYLHRAPTHAAWLN